MHSNRAGLLLQQDAIQIPLLSCTFACVRGETTIQSSVNLGAVDSIAHIFGGSVIHAMRIVSESNIVKNMGN